MSGIGDRQDPHDLTVPGLLSWRRAIHPDRVAIEVAGGASLTFAQWDQDSSVVASALRRKGIERGSVVGLIFSGRDWTSFAVAYCGVQKAGATAVPLHDQLPQARNDQLLAACSAAHVIRGDDMAELTTTRTVDAVNDARPEDVAQILFTSGTSGRPKAVAATHANLTSHRPAHPRRMALAHSERFLHAFPIGTNAAQTMLLNSLTAKPAAVALPQFTPRRFAQHLPDAGTVFLVPAMAIELLDSGVLAGIDLSGVHLVGSTAAALPPAIAMRLSRAFPHAAIVNYYTSTEAAPSHTSMIFDPQRPDAVGRPAPGAVRICDADGNRLPDGHVGEVWLRCANPRRYLGDDAATRSTFRDGWVRMGDVGRLRDGFLYLSDRDSDVVKSGAYKISTLEVEAALYEHPAVTEAAVVGLPHPVLGVQLAAVVVARPGAGEVALPALRAFLAQRLADYQLPGDLIVVDRLPRNDSGKVLKRRLTALFTSRKGR